jgi:hypothetical protein
MKGESQAELPISEPPVIDTPLSDKSQIKRLRLARVVLAIRESMRVVGEKTVACI